MTARFSPPPGRGKTTCPECGRRAMAYDSTHGSAKCFGCGVTAKRRTNVLDDDIAAEVAELCAGHAPDDPMFLTPTGAPHKHERFYRPVFLPAVKRAGLPDRTRFHDLRHTGISLLLAEGMPVVDVARWAGHASPTVTLTVYAHVIPDQHDRPARAFAQMRTDWRSRTRPTLAVVQGGVA